MEPDNLNIRLSIPPLLVVVSHMLHTRRNPTFFTKTCTSIGRCVDTLHMCSWPVSFPTSLTKHTPIKKNEPMMPLHHKQVRAMNVRRVKGGEEEQR